MSVRADTIREMVNERLTGKLRYYGYTLEVPVFPRLQQEWEILTHRYNEDSSWTQETKELEWRDVPCESDEK